MRWAIGLIQSWEAPRQMVSYPTGSSSSGCRIVITVICSSHRWTLSLASSTTVRDSTTTLWLLSIAGRNPVSTCASTWTLIGYPSSLCCAQSQRLDFSSSHFHTARMHTIFGISLLNSGRMRIHRMSFLRLATQLCETIGLAGFKNRRKTCLKSQLVSS